MEKVLIVGCQRVMDTVCIACSRCHVALNRRDGGFARYTDAGTGVELLGVLARVLSQGWPNWLRGINP